MITSSILHWKLKVRTVIQAFIYLIRRTSTLTTLTKVRGDIKIGTLQNIFKKKIMETSVSNYQKLNNAPNKKK